MVSRSGLDLLARGIPQTVSAITHQQLDAQGVTDICEALNKAFGVTMLANDPGESFYSRGFFICKRPVRIFSTQFKCRNRKDKDVERDNVYIFERIMTVDGEPS